VASLLADRGDGSGPGHGPGDGGGGPAAVAETVEPNRAEVDPDDPLGDPDSVKA
jgi:hypothetical protein